MTFPSPTCPHLRNPGPLKIVHTFQAELIFVTNITNYICGEKIVMWRNFWKIWEILGDFATIYVLSYGEELNPKSTFVEENDKYEV